MIAFCVLRRPKSYNAKLRIKYMAQIKDEFRKTHQGMLSCTDDLYSRIYYFHAERDPIDADNMSKPILDALKDVAFSDDKQVVYRIAASINVTKYVEIDYSHVPTDIVGVLTDAISQGMPAIYIEVGQFSGKFIQFGANLERG